MAGVFDGSSAAKVSWAPFTDLTQNFALSIWLKPTSLISVTPFLISRYGSGYYTFLSLNSSGKPALNSRNGGTSYIFSHGTAIASGTWSHVFVHWVPNGAVSIWLNGVKATGTLLGCCFAAPLGLNNTQLGSFSGTTGAYTGRLYDATLWKGLALPSDANVSSIFGGADPESTLGAAAGRWKMDASGTLLNDSVASHNMTNVVGTVTFADDLPIFGATVEIAPVGANASVGAVDAEATRRGAPIGLGASAGAATADATRDADVAGVGASVGIVASPSAGDVNIAVAGANASAAIILVTVIPYGINRIAEPFLDGSMLDDGTGFLNDFDDEDVWTVNEVATIQAGDDSVSGYVRVPAGAGRVLTFNILDANGNAINLSGARAEWVLAQQLGDPAVVQKTENNGISFPAAGVLTVDLAPADTIGLSGQYVHELNIEVGGQTKPEFVGILEVAPSTAGLMG